MKKGIGIAIISLTLASCGGTQYLPCPAYSSNDNYYETEGIHENLTQKEYDELVACEDTDEIN